jgi:poly(A) polymerase
VAAPGLARISSERVYAELRRVISSDRAGEGMRLALELGLCAVVLPELERLRGVEQSHYHHLDALDHTLAVLDCVIELQRDPWRRSSAASTPTRCARCSRVRWPMS